MITAKKPRVLEIWLLVSSGARGKEATIIILAFYFSDPFPLFLVQDHFSCKYVPRIKDACKLEANVQVQAS